MAMTDATVEKLAGIVDEAALGGRAIVKLTDEYPDMDLADAYAVQDALRARFLARGDRIVGYKCGLTSKAKMEQMGVSEPGYGFLTSTMWRPDGDAIAVSELIHPKVEPEVAFVLARDLSGPGVTAAAVIEATDFVAPAIEIIDSRYEAFKFDLPSVLADNASSSRFVVGGHAMPVSKVDLRALGVVLEKNGETAALAAAAAVMGHPAEAAAALINHLGARGETVPAGSVILSGGVTEAIAVAAGDHVTAHVQALGDVSIRFE